MSGGSVRRLAAGLALAAALSLVPVRPAAAAPVLDEQPTAQVAGLWQAALEWLSSLWIPQEPEPGPAGGTNAAGLCKSDQGVCIDPNG